MKIGIVSNSDLFIPLAGALAAQQQQVYLFYSPSPDSYINQKVSQYQRFASIAAVEETSDGSNLYEWISNSNLDVCFILGYKRLINIGKLKNLATQIFNIHFGPLPEYKGPTPIFWQLKHGEKKLGLVIHKLTQKYDEGPIVWRKSIDNQKYYSYKYVELLFSNICVEGVIFILNMLYQRIPILELANTGSSSYHTKPSMNDVLIRWEEMGALEICQLVQACNPWNKGALTFYNGQEVKLMGTQPSQKVEKTVMPGQIVALDDKLTIACANCESIETSMILFADSYIPSNNLKYFGIKKEASFSNFIKEAFVTQVF
jgi:methionyl-tRNA formyltransferase